MKRGCVEAGFRGVGNRCRGKRVAGVIGRRRLRIFAVGLEEANVEEEGRVVGAAQEFDSTGSDIGGRGGLGLKNLVRLTSVPLLTNSRGVS